MSSINNFTRSHINDVMARANDVIKLPSQCIHLSHPQHTEPAVLFCRKLIGLSLWGSTQLDSQLPLRYSFLFFPLSPLECRVSAPRYYLSRGRPAHRVSCFSDIFCICLTHLSSSQHTEPAVLFCRELIGLSLWGSTQLDSQLPLRYSFLFFPLSPLECRVSAHQYSLSQGRPAHRVSCFSDIFCICLTHLSHSQHTEPAVLFCRELIGLSLWGTQHDWTLNYLFDILSYFSLSPLECRVSAPQYSLSQGRPAHRVSCFSDIFCICLTHLSSSQHTEPAVLFCRELIGLSLWGSTQLDSQLPLRYSLLFFPLSPLECSVSAPQYSLSQGRSRCSYRNRS